MCTLPEFKVGSKYYRLYSNGACSGKASKAWCYVMTGQAGTSSHTYGPRGDHPTNYRLTAGYAGRSCPNNHGSDVTFTAGGNTFSAYPQYTNNQYYDYIKCSAF